MIGFYDYTVVLTYCSIISAIVGIVLSLGATAHPQWAVFLLLLSGLCDAFDGKVARTKKNRTRAMQNFGIQIDSLADIVAFGILPVCIGLALWNYSAASAEAGSFVLPYAVPILISCLYILAAVVRLAYFNVTEEERQSIGASKREFYTGLPVTAASLILPHPGPSPEADPGRSVLAVSRRDAGHCRGLCGEVSRQEAQPSGHSHSGGAGRRGVSPVPDPAVGNAPWLNTPVPACPFSIMRQQGDSF